MTGQSALWLSLVVEIAQKAGKLSLLINIWTFRIIIKLAILLPRYPRESYLDPNITNPQGDANKNNN